MPIKRVTKFHWHHSILHFPHFSLHIHHFTVCDATKSHSQPFTRPTQTGCGLMLDLSCLRRHHNQPFDVTAAAVVVPCPAIIELGLEDRISASRRHVQQLVDYCYCYIAAKACCVLFPSRFQITTIVYYSTLPPFLLLFLLCDEQYLIPGKISGKTSWEIIYLVFSMCLTPAKTSSAFRG